MEEPLMIGSEHLWPGRFHKRLHISTRQYARLVRNWVKSTGLDPASLARIRCDGPRWRTFTRRLVTLGLSSSCLATPRWTALSAISGSGPVKGKWLEKGRAVS
jgi:hypothetical protein